MQKVFVETKLKHILTIYYYAVNVMINEKITMRKQYEYQIIG